MLVVVDHDERKGYIGLTGVVTAVQDVSRHKEAVARNYKNICVRFSFDIIRTQEFRWYKASELHLRGHDE